MLRAVISFCVKVPVLSLAITVAQPNDSTTGSFLMIAFERAILITPRASVTVTQMGSPSGMAATAKLTATVTVSRKGRPINHPSRAMTAMATLDTYAKVLPSSSILIWRGLLRLSTSPNSCATFPNSVRSPTATTNALPLPLLTSVPIKQMLH